MMQRKVRHTHHGFTLVETLVGVAVFVVVSMAIYQAYVSLFAIIGLNQYKIMALNLANEQFEIARNLSYSKVGEIGGVPAGQIPHVQTLVRGGITFIATTTVRNVDLPFDGTLGGSPSDASPADNKLIEIEIGCPACKNFTPLTTTATIAPRNLETASTNGALFVKVFDANGQAVPSASVHIVNSKVTPNIVIDDVTNEEGDLQVIDVPPGLNAYNITVTKSGYSTAKTYAPGASGNPTPLQPDASVLLQQVTQVSFSIDKLSTISFSSLSLATCSAVGGINFSLTGSKSIGTDHPKYEQDLVTSSSGKYTHDMEWDSYTVGSTDGTYDIVGVNPLNSISLIPNSSQNVVLVVASKQPKSLLVTVKDNATGLPVSHATVVLTNTSGYASTKVTSRGYTNQTDWSGGDSQTPYFDTTRYFSDSGSIETRSPFGVLKLKNIFGSYSTAGVLESSTIDTGGESNFGNFVWSPTDQPISAGSNSVRFQFASQSEASTSDVWDYKGPDGTPYTYYTLSNSTINSVHNHDRYARYKVFLSTNSSSVTPNISDIAFTYTSSCTPPGQVLFTGLGSGTYHIDVAGDGYLNGGETDVTISSDWSEKTVTLSP